MAILSDQQTRIQLLLQEGDTSPTRQQQLAVAHQEALTQLARLDTFGEIVWRNVVAGTAQYTLPEATVEVVLVVYNEQRLDYASETHLDRWHAGWEALAGEPQWYTTSAQAPTVIRLVPQPVRTGSAVPALPPVPLIGSLVDNLVVFVTLDVADGITDATDVIPCRDAYLDWLVYETTRALASREVDTQNLPLAALCTQLAGLYQGLLTSGGRAQAAREGPR